MRNLIFATLFTLTAISAPNVLAKASFQPVFETKIVEHGGGCRKSSPPGQCCHMERRTGTVHCH